MLSNLYARVSARLGDPVIRGRALALFAGKMIGLILLVASMKMAAAAMTGERPDLGENKKVRM